MTINQTYRLVAAGVALALIMLTGHLTVASGMPGPPQDGEPAAKVKQLQRELNDLKQSYAKLQEAQNKRLATSPTVRFGPAGTAGTGWPTAPGAPGASQWRNAPRQLPQVADPFASRATTAYGVAIAPVAGFYRYNREAEQKVGELVGKMSEAEDESEKAKLKEELKTELSRQYDAYLESLEEPLIKMEERLDALREQFENRKSMREEMIKHRLDALWYDANGMGWPGSNLRIGRELLPSVSVPGELNAVTPRPATVGSIAAPRPTQPLPSPEPVVGVTGEPRR